jgi:hypothetical protein
MLTCHQLPLLQPTSYTRSGHLEFVLDKMSLGQALSLNLLVYLANSVNNSTFINHSITDIYRLNTDHTIK